VEEDLNQGESNADVEDASADRGRLVTILLLVVAIMAVLALVVWLAMLRLGIDPLNLVAPASTPTAVPELPPTATSPGVVQATPTPTRVVAEAEPSPTPQPAATEAEGFIAEVSAPLVGERVRNGSFEAGFEDHTVGLGWESFNNGGAIFEFLEETWPPAVFDGRSAQRIQVREASQPDRYAGIYQTVNVVPGETYELTLHGQTRTGEGDIQASDYGYRMQLGIDYDGGGGWTAVEDWVELPWDEQRFDSESLFFYDYVTPVVATGSRLTIFIRTWNKWPDPGRVEYTLDAISLRGLTPSEEIAIDKPLPETGNPGSSSVDGWARLLASVVVLGLLVAGAIWQIRRQPS
jgi:hypothetical protein